MATKTFHFHNEYHLGDNLLNLKFFFYLSKILKEKNYVINYYYDTTWPFNTPTNFAPYIDSSVVTMKPLREKPHDSIELWMGRDIDGIKYRDFEKYYNAFYKQILNYFDIDDPQISTSLWIEEPFMLDVYNRLNPKYKDIDILILNERGFSWQYNNANALNNLAIRLSKKFNVVTQKFISDDIKYINTKSIQDIGAISTHAKYVVGPISGPFSSCLNKYSKDYVKKWFMVGDKCKFYTINHVFVDNVNDIQKFFDSL